MRIAGGGGGGGREQRFQVPKALGDKLADTLINNGIRHTRLAIRDGEAFQFAIQPFVRSRYHFSADIDNEQIALQIINYKSLWRQKNRFSTAQITQALLDALTRHVMREEDDYNAIIGNVLSDDARTEIREKLKKEAAKNRARIAEPPPPPSVPKKTLLGRFLKK